jgi:hypothetical protein
VGLWCKPKDQEEVLLEETSRNHSGDTNKKSGIQDQISSVSVTKKEVKRRKNLLTFAFIYSSMVVIMN